MTTLKKLVSLALTVMLLCACFAANAATITMNGGTDGSQYSIYRILDATVSEDGTNIAYFLNDKYDEVLISVLGDEPIEALKALDGNATELDAKAKQIYDAIVAANIDPDATASGSNASADAGTGYVLVAETQLGDEGDTYSLLMLSTAKGNNININTKENVPQLEKKLKETNDTTGDVSGWQDGADYDLGDDVPFKLIGTLSDRYDSYQTYYYQFTDEICDGLTFNKDVRVVVDNGGEETDVTSAFTTAETATGFTVTCTDLKQIPNVTIDKDSEIVVYYTAKLNEQSVIGSAGNPNKAMLTYNNNPYYDGTGTGDDAPDSEKNTSVTPWDQVIVFTYELDVDKVDGSSQPLEGATFQLMKKEKQEDGSDLYVEVATIEGTSQSEFAFQRLDAGEYLLKETKAPAGYNPVDDITFTITADYDTEADSPAFGTLTVDHEDFEANATTGIISTGVINLTGTELPTTGGIGTTIFYVVGGVLVLLAVVLLVTKRRVGEEN
ncbi:MAG: isopeptide-forming domain-containing fimbrial protein [Clostridia bacterium]|nr:isopeptide-forming domain-containing fimbrial protein [Clostridia bacterium]